MHGLLRRVFARTGTPWASGNGGPHRPRAGDDGGIHPRPLGLASALAAEAATPDGAADAPEGREGPEPAQHPAQPMPAGLAWLGARRAVTGLSFSKPTRSARASSGTATLLASQPVPKHSDVAKSTRYGLPSAVTRMFFRWWASRCTMPRWWRAAWRAARRSKTSSGSVLRRNALRFLRLDVFHGEGEGIEAGVEGRHALDPAEAAVDARLVPHDPAAIELPQEQTFWAKSFTMRRRPAQLASRMAGFAPDAGRSTRSCTRPGRGGSAGARHRQGRHRRSEAAQRPVGAGLLS